MKKRSINVIQILRGRHLIKTGKLTYAAAARRLGVRYNDLYYALAIADPKPVRRSKRYRKLTNWEKGIIVSWRKNGTRIKDICRLLKLTYSAVYGFLSRRGMTHAAKA